jgi:CDP-glycerol glycerophosphotransferase
VQIVYHSFGGRFSDSPRALYLALRARAPRARHVWFADAAHRAGFPPGIETVPFGSQESVRALETADLVVANTYTYTELAWKKALGARYLQTWHGTPLKRLHRDALWAPLGELEQLERDVARWDLLLSPNAVSTPRLRSAFGFTGEVLETGYPRNDVLLAPDRDAIRARVRSELGLADSDRAVLYAPTWRDDVFHAQGKVELELDVERLLAGLGSQHRLLLRLHYLLTGRLGSLEHPGVRDVSYHPEIGELYLAADVLLTDYSSSMFDFAVTGKPMLFYAYDLARYRDELRGFYFDFPREAPGPLLETTDELVEALRHLPDVSAAYEDRYATFRATFCPLDDGHATERVVGRLLSGLPPGEAVELSADADFTF